MASLTKNVLFSTILTISNFLFPLITFPYISRVLGVNNIGICNFVDSIVRYFIIFSMMGMAATGIREVARSKGNREELSRTFSSLLTLNLITSFTAIIVLLIAVFVVPQLKEYESMFYIGAGKILANTLLIEWFYKGLEDFKFITVRTIVIRSLYVVSVLLLVKQQDDYVLYFTLTSLVVVVNATVNMYYSRHFISFSLKGIAIKPYLKSFLILGIYLVLTNLYTTFNVAYLGFATDTTQVGYYTTATKLYSIIMGFFTAFTGVMLPRMSSLIAEGKQEEIKRMTLTSVEILLSLTFPLIIIAEICAPTIINIVAGTGYEGAILPMRILMPLMLVIGYEQILVLQILMPMKQDTVILRNSILGAVVAVVFNILLVGKLASMGTAIVWILCEISVCISAQYNVSKILHFGAPIKSIMKRIILAVPIMIVCIFIATIVPYSFLSLVIISAVTLTLWSTTEVYLFKNALLKNNIKKVIKRVELK